MQALQAVMLAGRGGTLRSARLPPRTVVEAAAMGKGVLPRVLAVVAEANVRRVPLRPHRVHTAAVVVVVVPLLLVSMPQAAAVVGAAASQLD